MKDFWDKWGGRLLLGAVVVLVIAGLLVLKSCNDARSAKTQAKLSTGQAGAAIDSGKDAVNTLGNRTAADDAGDTITKENSDAIHNAQGADAPVTPAVRDAGLASLCRRAAHKRDPKCLQRANP